MYLCPNRSMSSQRHHPMCSAEPLTPIKATAWQIWLSPTSCTKMDLTTMRVNFQMALNILTVGCREENREDHVWREWTAMLDDHARTIVNHYEEILDYTAGLFQSHHVQHLLDTVLDVPPEMLLAVYYFQVVVLISHHWHLTPHWVNWYPGGSRSPNRNLFIAYYLPSEIVCTSAAVRLT